MAKLKCIDLIHRHFFNLLVSKFRDGNHTDISHFLEKLLNVCAFVCVFTCVCMCVWCVCLVVHVCVCVCMSGGAGGGRGKEGSGVRGDLHTSP